MLRSHRPSLLYGLGRVAHFKPPFLNYRLGQMTLLRLLGGTRERIRVIMLRANTLLTARVAPFKALCMHLFYPHAILCSCYFCCLYFCSAENLLASQSSRTKMNLRSLSPKPVPLTN